MWGARLTLLGHGFGLARLCPLSLVGLVLLFLYTRLALRLKQIKKYKWEAYGCRKFQRRGSISALRHVIKGAACLRRDGSNRSNCSQVFDCFFLVFQVNIFSNKKSKTPTWAISQSLPWDRASSVSPTWRRVGIKPFAWPVFASAYSLNVRCFFELL